MQGGGDEATKIGPRRALFAWAQSIRQAGWGEEYEDSKVDGVRECLTVWASGSMSSIFDAQANMAG